MQIRNLFVAIVCLVVIGFVSEQSQAQGPNNLFSQYYTQGAGQVHAEMYPAPHPVPRHVGSSYYTYQPLMPHELMYAHGRDYYNFYAPPASFYSDQCGNGRSGYGYTKTSVRWQSGCNAIAPLPGTLNGLGQRLGGSRGVRRGPTCNGLRGLFGGIGSGGRDGRSSFDGAVGEFDSQCETCGSYEQYAAAMEQARHEAAARTADAMQNRYSR